MDRKRLNIPQKDLPQSEPMKRRRSILPIATPRDEIERILNLEPKISESPSVALDSHTARRPKFEERFNRVTTYIDKGLHARMRRLYDTNQVESITKLVNAALAEYIRTHFTDL